MEPGVLVASAVTLLVSFLTSAGEAAAKKAGEDLFSRLKARLDKNQAAKEALTDLAKKPKDADTQAQMRVQLKKAIETDTSLVQELMQIVRNAQSDTEIKTTSIRQKAGDNAIQIGTAKDVNISQKK